MNNQALPPNVAPPQPAPTPAPAPGSANTPAPPLAASAPMPSGKGGGVFSPKVRLIVASVLLVGWLGWLTVTALTKDRGPVVSRAQAAAAEYVVVADVVDEAQGRVKVVDVLSGTGPGKDTEFRVTNLKGADGITGPGPYLLLLKPVRTAEVGQPESLFQVVLPNGGTADLRRTADEKEETRGPKPRVYPWDAGVQKQAKELWPAAGK